MDRSRKKSLLSLASAILGLLLASAVGTGTSLAANGPGGGMSVPATPQISDAICLAGCTQLRTGSPGGKVEITGSSLGMVQVVSFRGRNGRIRVQPSSVESTRLTAPIPDEAITGKLRVIAVGESSSNLSPAAFVIGAKPKSQGSIRVTDASSTPVKAYQFGFRKPTLNFIVTGQKATTDLRIDVINSRGTAIQSLFRSGVPTNSPQKVTWAGKMRSGKRAPNGAYRFQIRTAEGSNAQLSKRLSKQQLRARTSANNGDPFGFRMYAYIFPVAGPHQFWGGIGNGRGHQGIDIGARCGLPIRAARAGTVYFNSYQAGGAGNYVVINTTGNGGKSHVYMHMPQRSRFKVGAKVKTGQVIGNVGSTGRSSGCHLHFEQWSGPGWYQGGTFMNPLSQLKIWDRYS